MSKTENREEGPGDSGKDRRNIAYFLLLLLFSVASRGLSPSPPSGGALVVAFFERALLGMTAMRCEVKCKSMAMLMLDLAVSYDNAICHSQSKLDDILITTSSSRPVK